MMAILKNMKKENLCIKNYMYQKYFGLICCKCIDTVCLLVSNEHTEFI